MNLRQRNSLIFLCVLAAVPMALLVLAYQWLKPVPAVSVLVAVKFIEVDEACIGVDFNPLPPRDGTR